MRIYYYEKAYFKKCLVETLTNLRVSLAALRYSRACRYLDRIFLDSTPILISVVLSCVKRRQVYGSTSTYRVIISLTISQSLGLITSCASLAN